MQEHRFGAAINDSIKNCIINYNNSQTQKSEKRLNKPFSDFSFCLFLQKPGGAGFDLIPRNIGSCTNSLTIF